MGCGQSKNEQRKVVGVDATKENVVAANVKTAGTNVIKAEAVATNKVTKEEVKPLNDTKQQVIKGGTKRYNSKKLSGLTALVTGASSGIGYESAIALAKAGANVVVGARREDRLAKLVNEIEEFGGKALAVKLDVTNAEQNDAAVTAAVKTFGQLDIVFLNAGVFSSIAKPIWETDAKTWRKNYEVNVFGVYHGLKSTIAQMVKQGKGGSIIVNSSAVGLQSQENLANHSGYTSSKFAVTGIVSYVSAEAAKHNIRVNAIAPGVIATDMTGGDKGAQQFANGVQIFKRPGQTKDIANAVLFLSNPDNNFVTGISLPVDGGFTSK
mmetsp:Transcript_19761/g.29544  ORF Transcript_19761/g.29544 Transcript_19761/m.29544 type:complete len:324 (+) Transcript_19761:114-1085(+)|eukprot:CAMPEP_0167756670 /NCGR_PEP_ID=MMETSP0110_2-20121227/9512_1 /TAXON_ID=629695 /ORGANISM="Gymnochlora sp., Strain CCMP2014" /LENGTH=323 /DNA_ID=CAMNT_0007642801 /DNA_START=44 /DNA_END=1015 /DNA_ORIENTATION=+